MANQYTALPMPERFWGKVDKSSSAKGCWIWRASFDDGGYGLFMFRRRPNKAHRVSWILSNGEIPDGLDVLHTCDVRACVNPAHLFLGTQLDNMRDCAAKGRIVCVPQFGEANPMSKLTDDQVRSIRKMLQDGTVTQREIARQYGVTPMAITRIKQGVAWTHVKEDGE